MNKIKYLWTGYMLVLILAGTGRLVQKVTSDTGGIASRYAPLLVALLLVVGIFGYLYQKPLVRVWFWQVVFWVSAAASTCAVVFSFYLAVFATVLNPAIALMLVVLFIIPSQTQIWQYSYRSKSLWLA